MYMYIYIIYTHIHMYMYIQYIYTYTHVYVYIQYIYTYTHVYMYVYTYIYEENINLSYVYHLTSRIVIS